MALDPASDAIRLGKTVRLQVAVAAVSDVTTVPTSALVSGEDGYEVRVVENNELTTVPVEIGAQGSELTEITDGVELGDQVVLADLDQAVTTDTESTTSGFGSGSNSGRGSASFGGGSGGDDATGRKLNHNTVLMNEELLGKTEKGVNSRFLMPWIRTLFGV